MLVATIPIIVLIVGVLMYALSANPKLSEIGRIMFFCGLFVALLVLGHEGAVRVLP
jgi:Na+/phosphate symporter